MKSFKFLTACYLIKHLLLLLLSLCISTTATLAVNNISLYVFNVRSHLSDDLFLHLPLPLDLSSQLSCLLSQSLYLSILPLIHSRRLPIHHLPPELFLEIHVLADNLTLQVLELFFLVNFYRYWV